MFPHSAYKLHKSLVFTSGHAPRYQPFIYSLLALPVIPTIYLLVSVHAHKKVNCKMPTDVQINISIP